MVLKNEKQIALKFLKNKKLKLSNLLSGENKVETTNNNSELKFKIDQSAGLLFLKYEVIND